MDIRQKIKELPTDSGVYIMKNATGEIIYIGKAKNLKNRVSQYFRNSKDFPVKVKAMVSNIADFSYIVTNTELEALALENNLIKKHQPYYNILLKDDKSYPYIKLNLKSDFPKLEVTRTLRKDGAKYFGPYIAGMRANEIIKTLCYAYPLRTCNVKITKTPKRPCLNYHLGLCSAPCAGKISKEDYKKLIDEVISFLNGHDDKVSKVLEQKMQSAAKAEQFETAIVLRDRLEMLKKLGRSTITYLNKYENLDVFAWATNGSLASLAVLLVRGGKSVGCETFHLIDVSLGMKESIEQFIPQYYLNARVPAEIVVPCEINEVLNEWLNQQRQSGLGIDGKGNVKITFAKKGEKAKLLEIAKKNAELALDKFVETEKRNYDYTSGAVDKLQEILKLKKRPRKMECYDISNISGVLSVASMVVFWEGKPDKAKYRRFRIKTVEGPNDFASMNEVLTRRFEESKKPNKDDESFSILPDLIVIDGGKGQLSSAYNAMLKCGVNVPMIGLAKKEEEVFLPNQSEPIVLPRSHNSLKMLQRIRDESHRFAITYHRSLRNKTQSILHQIEGIGPTKTKLLIKYFKGIDKIKTATKDELRKVKSLTNKDIDNIYKFFNES